MFCILKSAKDRRRKNMKKRGKKLTGILFLLLSAGLNKEVNSIGE
jgi:hypothetical protein